MYIDEFYIFYTIYVYNEGKGVTKMGILYEFLQKKYVMVRKQVENEAKSKEIINVDIKCFVFEIRIEPQFTFSGIYIYKEGGVVVASFFFFLINLYETDIEFFSMLS